jgi:hypothetical protein
MGASPHFGREIMWGPVPTRLWRANPYAPIYFHCSPGPLFHAFG